MENDPATFPAWRSFEALTWGDRMSDQFQHVMVLTSIIIGLCISHALIGFS
jgi:hypothetical protein